MGDSKQKLKDIFALIDSDGGGSISVEEVKKFVAALPRQVTDDEVSAVFNAQDSDGSGEIDDEEFCGLAEKLQESIGVPVQEMVDHFTTACYKDLFGLIADDGIVRMTELRSLVESMGTSLSGEDLRKIFATYDEDGSGSIEFEEFVGIANSIGQGMPISKLVHSFKEARQRAKERMERLKGKFGASNEEEAPQLREMPVRREQSARSATSQQACPQCPQLMQRIADLEAQLSAKLSENTTLKESMASMSAGDSEAKAQVVSLQEQLRKLQEENAGLKKKRSVRKTGDNAETKELRTKCERLEKQVESLRTVAQSGQGASRQLQELMQRNAALEKQLDQLKNTDTALLNQQIWALETALEIRTRELYALREKMSEFAGVVERYDAKLAEAMRESLRVVAARAHQEAMQQLGDTVDNVMKKRRAKKKKKEEPSRPPSVDGEMANMLAAKTRELEVIEAENRRLQKSLSDLKINQTVSSYQPPPPQPTPTAATESLRRELVHRNEEISQLKRKLRKAQEAIIAAAGEGFENDVKLQQARKSLQAIRDYRTQGSPTGSPAGSPRRTNHSQSPANSPHSSADPSSQPHSPAHHQYIYKRPSPSNVVHSPMRPPPGAYPSPTVVARPYM